MVHLSWNCDDTRILRALLVIAVVGRVPGIVNSFIILGLVVGV
jgi:hypothetical protein